MHSQPKPHFQLSKRVLRYIKGTLHHGILVTPSSFNIHAHTNADWVRDTDDRRSTTGYCIFLSNSLISCQVRKQKIVTQSSMKAEYCALTTIIAEII